MFTVTTRSARSLRFTFVHSSPDPTSARPNAGPLRIALDHDASLAGRRLTLCEVSETTSDATGETYRVLGQGVSVCHPNDTFDKAVGRKLALRYALQAASDADESAKDGTTPLTDADRLDVWTYYLPTTGQQVTVKGSDAPK